MSEDFKAAWSTPVSEATWETFLSETFSDESRNFVYDIITKYASSLSVKPVLAEIGFGQCFDFVNCYKNLHDENKIVYSGYDITEQFVSYANKKFPGYNFSSLNFFEDENPKVNISYTRHVFEHQDPDKGYISFENFLKKTSDLSIVTWFVPPGRESFRWISSDGFDNKGAYVNSYYSEKIDDIIKSQGFNCEKVFHGKCMIYVMKKGTPA